MADVARLAIQVDTDGVQRARQALRGLQDGSVKARQATDQLGKATGGRLRNSFRAARGQTAQFGQQIQDVAIQAQAGTSAFTILAQQGTQIASIFGPGGAALGAVLAIGSAISGVLYTSLTGATQAADKLLEKTQDLTDEFEDATEAQRVFAAQEFRTKLQQQNATIEERRQRLQEAREELERLQDRQGRDFTFEGRTMVPVDQEAIANAIGEQQREIVKLSASLDNAEQKGQEYRDQIQRIINPQKELTEEQERAQETVSQLVQSTTEQANALGMSERMLALQEARLNGATEAQLLWINANFDAIEAYDQQQQQAQQLQQQLKQNRKEYEQSASALESLQGRLDPASDSLKQTRQDLATVTDAFSRGLLTEEEADLMVDRITRVEDAGRSFSETMNLVGSLQGGGFAQAASAMKQVSDLGEGQIATFQAVGAAFDNLTQLTKQGGKEQFDTYKRLAQAQAVISSSLAILSVLDDPAVPTLAKIPLAGTIGAMAAVQVATIEQQQYQGGRAMGGQVSAGNSYMVGEQGPEVITMGSQGGFVTPNHQMGGGNNNNVTQVFQLSDNARREAKQQILESAPMIRNMAKQAVIEAAQNGGTMSRTVGRRS